MSPEKALLRQRQEDQEQETAQPDAKKMKMANTKCVLRFAKLTERAFEPIRGSARAAGLDLRSAYDVVVPARGKAVVKTDLQVHMPEGSYGRVAPRSGLAVKNFIDVGAGVVDEDYRGNLGVVLFNHSDAEFEVKRGDRIAQFICERIFYPELEELDKLEETQRGSAGFGSTGVKELPEKNGHVIKNGTTDKNGDAKGHIGATEKSDDDAPKNGTAEKDGDSDAKSDTNEKSDADAEMCDSEAATAEAAKVA